MRNTLQCFVLGFLETVYGSLMWVYVCIRVSVYAPTKCFHTQHMHTYLQIKKYVHLFWTSKPKSIIHSLEASNSKLLLNSNTYNYTAEIICYWNFLIEKKVTRKTAKLSLHSLKRNLVSCKIIQKEILLKGLPKTSLVINAIMQDMA